jgi:hypothetical protein
VSRRKVIGLLSIIGVIIIVVSLSVMGVIDLTDFYTQLAVGLILLIPTIGYFTLGPEIERRTTSRISTAESPRRTEQGPSSVSQVVGSPNSIENKIQHYNTRDELRFGELLSLAHKKIEMSALTFYIVTLQYLGDVETTINRGVKITFLLLDPHSKHVQRYTQSLHASQDMKYQIEKSLELLCDLKNRLDSRLREKLEIKTYDSYTDRSIIVIDSKIIKVEDRPMGSDSKSRPNHLTFKKDNKDYFRQYLREHNRIVGKDHKCA